MKTDTNGDVPLPSEAQPADSLESDGAIEQANSAHQAGEIPPSKTSGMKGLQPKKLWPIAILVMVAIVGIVSLRAYRSLMQEPAVADQTETEPSRLPVRVVRAERGLAQQWVFDEGTVGAVRRRVLKFEADGDINFIAKTEGRDLREGDLVRQGELLATIDDRKQQSAIDTAEADLKVALQERNQAQAALAQAQASYTEEQSDLDLAITELRRYQGLFEQGAVSESDRDVYANREDQAQAALEVAQQDIRSAEDGVRSADASVEAAEARLRQAKIDLEDTQLIAPIDGIVAYINIREGEYWDSQRFSNNLDQDIVETAPIVLIEPDTLEVELELQADAATAIQPGQLAYVVMETEVSAVAAAGAANSTLLDIARQRGRQGRVFAVSPTQTPGGRGVEVSIRDLQGSGNLQVGGRAYIWIEAATNANAILLPLGTLEQGSDIAYAFVVDQVNGQVERRAVEVGIQSLDGIEVRGLEPGELVVTEGRNRLVDGTLVEVVSEEEL
ncbi:MAG: multidrug transporter [Cyanobacteria bacterium P01_H01_bin.121]